jgi:hypothetical protein
MKAYVVTTGTVFTLILAAHIWRAIAEGASLAKNPIFIVTTALAAALAAWSWRVLKTLPKS